MTEQVWMSNEGDLFLLKEELSDRILQIEFPGIYLKINLIKLLKQEGCTYLGDL